MLFGLNLNIIKFDALALFGNKQILAAFLTTALAFILANAYSAKKAKHKFLLLFATITLVAAIVLVNSFVGLVGMIVAVFVFFLIASKRTVGFAIWLILLGVVAVTVLPLQWLSSVIPAFDITSSMIYPVIKTWNGVIKMIIASLFGGVGIGGMSNVYPMYAEAGFEQVGESGALWLRILCDTGIIGLVIFAILLFLYFQNCFEYIRKPLNKGSKIYIAANTAAVTGLLAVAATADIWSNMVMFYQFWLIITLACAGIRTDRRLIEKQEVNNTNSEYSASVDL
jgi:O-antigen ligase